MNHPHELRMLSSPSRSRVTSSSLSYYEREDHRGYLNRKSEGAMGRKTKVLHREKGWQLFWCNLKGTQLEFYKVEGVRNREPPRDVYPPANLTKTRPEVLDVEGSLVEIDYISQENKDIQKRRKFLFRVEQNNMEYIFQAPSANQLSLWFMALQRASCHLSIEPESSLGSGHAIRTIRDSIKHNRRQAVHRTRSPGLLGAQGGADDTEYIEYSAAEARVASGGDSRLQALRKRLQAKKELLKQLDRMYSSYLGGNAAAMYDDSLILQQQEPPTFNNEATSLFESQDEGHVAVRRSSQNTDNVIHHKLALNGERSHQNGHSGKSVDHDFGKVDEVDGMAHDTPSGPAVEMEDQKASNCEMVAMASLPESEGEVLTELLMDYYLVPGAGWSLLRKGELVKVLGRAHETGWYRCMALRKAQIQLDNSAFSFLDQHNGGGAGVHIKTRSLDENSDNMNNTSSDTPFSPSVELPPLSFTSSISSSMLSPLHLSQLSSCSLSGLGKDEGLFNMEEMKGTVSHEGETTPIGLDTVHQDIGSDMDNHGSLGADPQTGQLESLPEHGSFMLADLTNFLIPSMDSVEDDLVPFSTSSEMSLSLTGARLVDVKNFEEEVTNSARPLSDEEDSKITDSIEHEEGESLGGASEKIILRRSVCRNRKVMRPTSYQLATDEAERFGIVNDEMNSLTGGDKKGGGDHVLNETEAKKNVDETNKKGTVKRSTSTITTSSPAVINLRRTIGINRTPRSQSSTSGYGLPSLSMTGDLRRSFLTGDWKKQSWSKLDRLIEMELGTGTYPAPLIGCIPPSVLKCFIEKVGVNQSPSVGGDAKQEQNGVSVEENAAQSQNGPTQTRESFLGWNTTSTATPMTDPEHSSVINGVPEQREGELGSNNSGDQQQPFPFAMSVSLEEAEEDSDGEADRRQALIFTRNSTINPDDDLEFLRICSFPHERTRSLPPSVLEVLPYNNFSGDMGGKVDMAETLGDVDVESSLDRRPSSMRKLVLAKSLDLTVPYLESHSVGSSPIHRVTLPQPPPPSPAKSSNKVSSSQDAPSVVGLFDSVNSGKGVLKKLFSRRTKPQQPQPPQQLKFSPSESLSGRLSPGLLRQVLLDDKELEEGMLPRLHVSSVSGRIVRQEGMAIVIGDDSSSDSEADECNSNASSCLQEDCHFSPQHGRYGYFRENSSLSSVATPCDDSMLSLGSGRGEDKTEERHDQEDETGRIAESDVLGCQFQSRTKLKRSVSEHDTFKLRGSSHPPSTDAYAKTGSTSSLKRNTSIMNTSLVKMIKKTTQSMTTPSDSSSHHTLSGRRSRFSKKKKKRPPSAYVLDKEDGQVPCSMDQGDPTIKMSGIFRQPPRGELRHVYLETSDGKYGFRLQCYGRIREQGKVLQTFVQSVAPGTPAFLAGLYPGDAIVEVGGVDVKYAPVDTVVEAIRKGADKGDRVQLKVEFVDGVTRLDCMRKAEEFKNEINRRQNRLTKLMADEKHLPPASPPLPSPVHVISAYELPVWEKSLPSFECVKHNFPFNRQLNQVVAIHCGDIMALECEALVMPISSCHKPTDTSNKNLLLQLLRTGGPGLMDDVSLAKQCKIGNNIVTWGHALPAKYIYHCMFGDLEESLQSCCFKALETAITEKLSTVVFWLDGFASLSVSPHLVIEAVRNWMQQDVSRNTIQRVVFSSKANCTLVEQIMRNSFPLYPKASCRDSGISYTDVQSNESGTESQNEVEHIPNGTEPFQNGFVSVKKRIESLQGRVGESNEIHRCSQADRGRLKKDDNSGLFTNEHRNSKFVEYARKTLDPNLGESLSYVSRFHQSIPSLPLDPPMTLAVSHVYKSLEFLNERGDPIFSPKLRLSISSTASGDLVLNPDRTESEV